MSKIKYGTRFRLDYYIPNSRSRMTYKMQSDTLGFICYDYKTILPLCESLNGQHKVLCDSQGNTDEIIFTFDTNEQRMAFEDSLKFMV